MTRENIVGGASPGKGIFINETGTRQYLSFNGFINETISAGSPIVGTAALSFTQTATGTLTRYGTGTAAATFTPSGTMAGAGPLSATTSLTFTQTLSGVAYGFITGTTALTFTQTGTGTADSGGSGTTALTFVTTAIISATVPIFSDLTEFSFSVSGNLGALGDETGEIAGETALLFNEAEEAPFLQGLVAIQATDTLVFDHVAYIIGEAPIVGTTALTFTQTATGKRVREAVGSTTLTFTQSTPSLKGSLPAQGTATLELFDGLPLAQISGFAVIGTASSSLTFSATSNLRTALFPETSTPGGLIFEETSGVGGGLFIETTAPLVTPPYLETA